MIGTIAAVSGLLAGGFLFFGRVRRARAGADSNADGGATRRPVAVSAQQWPDVKFLVEAEVSVARHFGAVLPRLNFNYRSQQDPDAVVAALGVAA